MDRPVPSPDDVKALAKLDPTELMAAIQQALTPQEQRNFLSMAARLVQVTPTKPRKPRSKAVAKKESLTRDLAQEKREENQSRFLIRLTDIEKDVMSNSACWEQGASLIVEDIPRDKALSRIANEGHGKTL